MKHLKKFKKDWNEIRQYVHDCFIDFQDSNELIFCNLNKDIALNSFINVYIVIKTITDEDWLTDTEISIDMFKKINDALQMKYDNIYESIDKIKLKHNINTIMRQTETNDGRISIYLSIHFK